ncbi:DUF1150 family protein [Allosediminivita pacifica]|uniref:DUF1150 family protein n=1 Tax=Allosediminivita pacifica TaxID=1267769 RepID=A0A2T6APK5_9RHOB|nr:DUF1150 family protein [Allosediminivita pacifica]PTX45710.1 hypothetical protein C8N44_12065 [Allosediminivita pacifica]GGB07334.1 hypothetical protein GCM10011324_16870 [Allosediminivita pacifica]
MDTKQDLSRFEGFDEGRLVYVRAVKAAELPEDVQEEVREQIGGADELYAVHRADGERLALVKDRAMAFVLARQNDLAPVTVH